MIHRYHLCCQACEENYWSDYENPVRRICFRCALALVAKLQESLERISQNDRPTETACISSATIAQQALEDPLAKLEDPDFAAARREIVRLKSELHVYMMKETTRAQETQIAATEQKQLQSEIARLQNEIAVLRGEETSFWAQEGASEKEVRRLKSLLENATEEAVLQQEKLSDYERMFQRETAELAKVRRDIATLTEMVSRVRNDCLESLNSIDLRGSDGQVPR